MDNKLDPFSPAAKSDIRQYSFRRVSNPLEKTEAFHEDDGGFQRFTNFQKIIKKRSATMHIKPVAKEN